MNPFVLYLFFMLDSFRVVANMFFGLTSTCIVIGLLVFSIGFLANRYEALEGETARIKNATDWCERWLKVWKWWRRILIPVFCVSLALNIFLPNTKQAVAIYVIPKVINAASQNKELMELPQDVVRVAKLYLNKMMVKWSQDIEDDLGDKSADTTGSAPSVNPTPAGKAEQAVKEAQEAYDKAMQALEAAKKVIQ